MVYPGMETCDSALSSVTFIEINSIDILQG